MQETPAAVAHEVGDVENVVQLLVICPHDHPPPLPAVVIGALPKGKAW